MLERAQRFILKNIQGFPVSTRSDMCTCLLGWISIQGYIHYKKLLFMGRLCRLDVNILAAGVFIRRLQMHVLDPIDMDGVIPKLMDILLHYGLENYIQTFLTTSTFPSKQMWKKVITEVITTYEQKLLKIRIDSDPDFDRFKLIHNKIEPFHLYRLCSKYPKVINYIRYIIHLIMNLRTVICSELCHRCGKMNNDPAMHKYLSCD